jgi:7-cyano-7-deazaguanine reductase
LGYGSLSVKGLRLGVIMTKEYKDLTQLGAMSPIPADPAEAVLESFPNPHPEVDYVVRLTAPEFTTMCPVTGQPDFAALIVDYVPSGRLVESKSFKLFLGSFRNFGTFHEDCTVYVHNRLKDALAPKYIRVVGLWYVRGGITIDVVVETGSLPPGCEPLPLGKTGYRGGRE